MITSAYLWLNAVMYLALGAWCAVKPASTAKALGFVQMDNAGRTEFLTIYGGLQMGLGAFFAVCAGFAAYRLSGIVFAVLLYSGIVMFRLGAMWRIAPIAPNTRLLATFEVLLLLGAVALLAVSGVR